MSREVDARVTAALHAERSVVWSVCYRMTGSTSTADDLTQDTLLRALERPPEDLDAPLRPWLVRVAVNLARDALRRRRREAYRGPWLPEPESTDDLALAMERRDVVQYGLLLAMERLTPHQRAVLVLRDVLELGEAETAEVLGSTVGSVKVALHRARNAVVASPEETPDAAAKARHAEAITALMSALAQGDVEATRALLAPEITVLQDGAGRVRAAMVPVRGQGKVLTFLASLARITPPPLSVAWIELNHLPALDVRLPVRGEPNADRFLMRVDLDARGRIVALHTLAAPDKLARFDARIARST